MSTLVIIDYGSGNLRSAAKAFAHAADSTQTVIVSANPRELDNASHIVLPGVGAFADCMAGLSAISGMPQALERNVLQGGKPFLGICVGMQMLLQRGFEHGEHTGLGWVKGDVVRLKAKPLKIPHMGWNELNIKQPSHPLLQGIQTGEHAYFVHSYHAMCADPADVLATCEYGGDIAAVIGRGNIMGTQFHPEKSQAMGLRLLRNFSRLR